MKFTAALLSLAACVAAAPVTELIERQIGAVGTTANELSIGSCRDIIFIFARGSTEIGNLGGSVGPPTCNGLKRDQGAAVMVASIRRLSSTIQNQIAGVVLYGNTRNAQENGNIPNFPNNKVETICALTDGVCYGTLTVTAGHLSYGDDVDDAVDFLSDRIGDA
ncbi:hypothetical protein KC332_g15292 [Hortaea werneckii]|uniref:cutinase n=1 Tax=Hortaea werneckii EXF-2000 TaxID=1157616 RepID=A0A1Z5SSG1_HORWE|nr:hypothetical protein KC358_g16737 [Hortaea werneckii]OTA23681.1 hypothetical protein BTJ68_13079 [Hortaea werneckii EXF-2000]KAI6802956.1 hypothetical protein KC350_g15322 [Hortaea werneckii]KAI6905074.1 hypothetical protein KC348_g15095 [Hortaea werneckii]KAI6922867.1 hypothetical protein KC341_g15119 [Hortaea werneckii]